MRGYKIPQRYDLADVSKRLDGLVRFLNFDFTSARDEELNNLAAEFKQLSGFKQFPRRKKARQIQQKLLRRILPIVTYEKKITLDEAWRVLSNLLRPVDQFPLRVRWGFAPIEYDPWGKKKLPPGEVQQQISRAVLFGESIFDAVGYKWRLSQIWEPMRRETFEDMLYFTFCMYVVQGGLIAKLKVCKACAKLFVQSDPRKEFCGSACKDAFHNKRRADAEYFTKRRRKLRRSKIEQARRLLKQGNDPHDVAEQTGLTPGILYQEGLV